MRIQHKDHNRSTLDVDRHCFCKVKIHTPRRGYLSPGNSIILEIAVLYYSSASQIRADFGAHYWVAVWQPSLKMDGICSVLLLFFFSSVSVKVLPVTPLVSGIFVHRAFCAYFLRIKRVVELRRFLWWTQ